MDPQIKDPETFYASYDSKKRFASYWVQIEEILRLRPKSILEIGVGNRFLSDYLKKIGFAVTTVDHEPKLQPDIVADANALPVPSGSFELVACFQVLEHLPWGQFVPCLKEMARVSKSHLLLSLPNSSPVFSLQIRLPSRKLFSWVVPMPYFPPVHEFDGEHYWEIGKRGHSLTRVRAEIERAGWRVEECYRPVENTTHQFFLLKKA